MRVLVRSLVLAVGAGVAVTAVGPVPTAGAATPKEIDTAIQRGMGYLREQYTGGNFEQGDAGHDPGGAGAAALAGLALLEGGAAPNDPAIAAIAPFVRKSSFTMNHTYQVGLAIMFLDRLGDPNDVPIIQMLAVRLLAGQNKAGGWTYMTGGEVPPAEQQRLEAAFRSQPMGLAPGQQAKSLHPAVAQHAQVMWAARDASNLANDNSNTQFGLLALWIARKNGVNAEAALALIEQRFLTTQLQTGGWGYTESVPGSPSMICVGLMALATGMGRQQERRLTATTAPKPEPKAAPAEKEKAAPKTDDPFFTPAKKEDPKKAERVGVAPTGDGLRDAAINRGFAALGQFLGAAAAQGGIVVGNPSLGNRDLYFLWCLERVGVIFGKERIGGVDWYEAGANALVRGQAGDGSWGVPGYPTHVNTSFAILFLSKSNVVRDLSSKIAGDTDKDRGKGAKDPKDPLEKATPTPPPEPEAAVGANGLPDNKAGELAAALLGASGQQWKTSLGVVREEKGSEFTYALVLAINRLDGERRRDAREALAERLTRMTTAGLRTMLKADDPEVRRAAALACGMKDSKANVSDLIDRLTDDEEFVARAALASLKSLTGQDHGPAVGATKDQRKAAADAWRAAMKKK
jgi:hypothetical protein